MRGERKGRVGVGVGVGGLGGFGGRWGGAGKEEQGGGEGESVAGPRRGEHAAGESFAVGRGVILDRVFLLPPEPSSRLDRVPRLRVGRYLSRRRCDNTARERTTWFDLRGRRGRGITHCPFFAFDDKSNAEKWVYHVHAMLHLDGFRFSGERRDIWI